MAKSVIEQLKEMDADLAAKIDAVVARHPKLAVDDRQMTELFSIYLGADEPATTTTPAATIATETPAATTTTATHTPAVPSSAATTSTPAATVAATTTSSTADSKAILDALNGLKSTMESKFKDVVTKADLPTLQGQMLESSIRNAHKTFKIEALHKQTFGEELDLEKLGAFIGEQKKAGIAYPDIEKAYMAMVSDKMNEKVIEQKVAEGVKQKLSAATVPGQTTSTSLSPAQQVMAKAKKEQAAEGGSRLQNLIDRASAIERARESSAVN